MEAKTNPSGIATVSVVTTTSPGIYSIKALAKYNDQEQEAHTSKFHNLASNPLAKAH